MPRLTFQGKLLMGVAGLAACMSAAPLTAQADEVLDNVLRRLEKLERENAQLRKKVDAQGASKSHGAPASAAVVPSVEAHKAAIAAASVNLEPGKKPSDPSIAAAAPPLASNDGWFLHKKDGPGLTFQTPGGEFGLYGQFDVSFDAASKGIGSVPLHGSVPAIGNTGWLPAISSNLSAVGIRGFQKIPDSDFRLVYQLETLIDVAVSAGTGASNSNQSNTVRGALTTRDSFVGLSDTQLGSLKIGKEQAPYKKSTDAFNPFNGMLGDYRVIMGNTGGDNRVEFAAFLEHSIWWESPDWNGLKLAALYSPGQNRSNSSDNIASGSSDCAGGNNPYSGGFTSCSDGAFSDAISLSGTYQKDGLLITTAYERHEKVNRSSDLLGIYGAPTQALLAADVAAEDAFKVGVLYKFPTKTTIGGIWEDLHRYVPQQLQFQNERQRQGTWAFLTQELTPKDEVSFGWAHAFKTPGDPGQHNSQTLSTADLDAAGNPGVYAPNDNEANLYTAVLKHKFSPALTWYINGAATINGPSAHYDLGAGGHGVTTDCHDAYAGGPVSQTPNANATAGGGYGANPRCFTGSNIYGISTGVSYKF